MRIPRFHVKADVEIPAAYGRKAKPAQVVTAELDYCEPCIEKPNVKVVKIITVRDIPNPLKRNLRK